MCFRLLWRVQKSSDFLNLEWNIWLNPCMQIFGACGINPENNVPVTFSKCRREIVRKAYECSVYGIFLQTSLFKSSEVLRPIRSEIDSALLQSSRRSIFLSDDPPTSSVEVDSQGPKILQRDALSLPH
jgi:hypothetical protein